MKKELLRLETTIIGIITNGLVHRTPKRLILANIRKEITATVLAVRTLKGNDTVPVLSRADAHGIWLDAVEKYTKISKKTFVELRRVDKKFGKSENYEENLKRRTSAVYNFVRKEAIMNESLVKTANSVARAIEQRGKWEEIYGINGFLKANREEKSEYSPFFLCSSHIDPAEDHKDWEGKMYYDEDWKNFVEDKDTRRRISAYIRNRRLRTVQWVCGEPVYMVTRPNCKHFFTKIEIEEALGNSPKSLIKKHKLYNPKEIPIPEEKVVLRRYSERLMIEKHLYGIIKDERLWEDIKKDTILVKKWTNICNRAPDSKDKK